MEKLYPATSMIYIFSVYLALYLNKCFRFYFGISFFEQCIFYFDYFSGGRDTQISSKNLCRMLLRRNNRKRSEKQKGIYQMIIEISVECVKPALNIVSHLLIIIIVRLCVVHNLNRNELSPKSDYRYVY